MSKISVLTVFKRPGGELLVKQCLDKQTFTDFEWIIVTPVKTITIIPDKTKILDDPPKEEGDVWCLNKAYNAGIRACTSELIVSIQDEVWFPEDGLEKFWFHYQKDKKGCVTGVGDKYLRLNKYNKPEVKIWDDPRKGMQIESYGKTIPNNWELNYCSIPKQGFYDIGGFDETFDKYYGWDNVDVALRLEHFGYRFYMDKTNESMSLKQEMPVDWEEKNAHNGGDKSFFEQLRKKRVVGLYPYKLSYLKEVKQNG